MDNFKEHDNDAVKKVLKETRCLSRTIPHNLTNWFQPLDLTVNKPAKSFITNKFNTWYADQVSKQLADGIEPAYVNVSTKLSDLKILHAGWIQKLYYYL